MRTGGRVQQAQRDDTKCGVAKGGRRRLHVLSIAPLCLNRSSGEMQGSGYNAGGTIRGRSGQAFVADGGACVPAM
jgi:hypothetical protein